MSEEVKSQLPRIKLGGLWKNTAKSGEQYLAGNLSATTGFQVFQNKFKQGEKDPDFIIYLVQRELKKREPAEGFNLDIAVNQPSVEAQSADPMAPNPNDIPF